MCKAVNEYEFEDDGVWCWYERCGASCIYTQWTACFVGVGTSAAEAANDAVENAACGGEWELDTVEVPDDMETDSVCEDCVYEGGESEDCNGCELMHYVVLYLR
jgi:hypothetical protein